MTVEIIVPGEPRAKARARVTRRGAYTDPVTVAHEQAIGWEIRRARMRPFAGNVGVAAVFYRSTCRWIDVDNLLKCVLDAANGIAWADDSQVTEIFGRIELDRNTPRTVIRFAESTSSMPRTAADTGRAKRPRQKGGS